MDGRRSHYKEQVNMKYKVCAVLICFFCVPSVWAGNFTWRLYNKSSGIPDATLKEQITAGIADGDTNTPSLQNLGI
jgi:hypothetical protein